MSFNPNILYQVIQSEDYEGDMVCAYNLSYAEAEKVYADEIRECIEYHLSHMPRTNQYIVFDTSHLQYRIAQYHIVPMDYDLDEGLGEDL